MMTRIALTITAVVLAGMMSGCCCGPVDCGNCDGGFVGYGGACGVGGGCGPCASPLNALAQVRKAFVCGTGCGEAYMDEWCSTPPDACDPCCGTQFVGGATPCYPCWYPGKALLAFLQCSGQRFCQFCNCVASQCSCGAFACGPVAAGGCCVDAGCGGGCGDGCGSTVVGEGVMGGEVLHSPGGCATCSSRSGGTKIATTTKSTAVQQQHYMAPVNNQRTARNHAVRRGVSRASSYHTRNTLYR